MAGVFEEDSVTSITVYFLNKGKVIQKIAIVCAEIKHLLRMIRLSLALPCPVA
jgi:hypothetical protein